MKTKVVAVIESPFASTIIIQEFEDFWKKKFGGEGEYKSFFQKRQEIFEKTSVAVAEYLQKERISKPFVSELVNVFIPMAILVNQLAEDKRKSAGTGLVLGINGAQGSGKTTSAGLLKILFEAGFGKKVAVLSIDDLYKTFAERQEMGNTVHPLFASRGVPGTHDVALGIDVITQLIQSSDQSKILIPKFSKSEQGGKGDRLPKEKWDSANGKTDIVIFEGWCVGPKPMDSADLEKSVPAAVAKEDPDGTWRKTSNKYLAGDYQNLFGLIDHLVMFKVPGMDVVFKNREHQEEKLREAKGKDNAMKPDQIIRLVELFQLLTEHMLLTLPDTAHITIDVSDDFKFDSIRSKL